MKVSNCTLAASAGVWDRLAGVHYWYWYIRGGFVVSYSIFLQRRGVSKRQDTVIRIKEESACHKYRTSHSIAQRFRLDEEI